MEKVKAAAAATTEGAAVAAAAAAPPPGDWYEAEISIPIEAAAINFVINYYEHYDNNKSKDHKILVALPEGRTRGMRIRRWSHMSRPRP